MSRVLAPRSRYDEAVGALAAQASSLVVGDPLAEETTMGPLANPRQRASVESCVTAGVSAGARVVVGGRRPATPVRGYYYEPTVFAGATAGMAIARDEICGPVVSVIPYDDESEAVAIANDSSYGLAGSVWTDDPERGLTDRAARAGRDVRGEPVRARPRGAVGRPQGQRDGQHLRAGGAGLLPGHQVRVPARRVR